MDTDTFDEQWLSAWGQKLALVNCGRCDSLFLMPAGKTSLTCPYCGQAALSQMDAAADRPAYTHPPELLLPFALSAEKLQKDVRRFARRTWFPPADLTPDKLIGRLQPVYLPMWLVDAQAQAQWQAETGFDYQVVSHREKYQNGRWQTEEVRETKIRWEPRVGALTRQYDNKVAPALEEHAQLEKILGRYKLAEARPYQADDLVTAAARLPNRSPTDAWPEAEAALKMAAAEECRQASGANHMRQFRWSAQFNDQHWTQMLLPLYTTYYYDDEGVGRMVFVQGQTGKLVGQRRASMKKARRWSLVIGGIAVVLFAVSMLLALVSFFEPRVWLLSGISFIGGVMAAVTAVVPILLAWYLNTYGFFFDDGQQLLADLAEASWQGEK